MKLERHSTIRNILERSIAERSPVPNQDDLRRRLAQRGHHVTQATLSRDVRELRLSKGPGGYTSVGSPAQADASPGIGEVLESFGLEARQAQNLLVLITTTGSAPPVAAAIDDEDWPEVVGTVAGDDTVLIVCADERKASALRTRIAALIG